MENVNKIKNSKLHLGSRLKELALKRNLDVVDMAKLLGLHQQGVYYIYKKPTIKTSHIQNIYYKIGITPNEIFGIEEEPPQHTINESSVSYGKKYIEQRIDSLEKEVENLKRDISKKLP
jgi:transcriptional regulator with XRE-family HTH domain